MTLIVGFRCKDGVVIGADGAVTHSQAFGAPTITQPSIKLKVLGADFIIGVSGPVGLQQAYIEEIEPTLKSTQGQTKYKDLKSAKSALHGKMWPHTKELWDKGATVAQTLGHQSAFNEVMNDTLLAFPCANEAHLINFDHKGLITEFDRNMPFTSIGGGKATADPFLAFLRRTFWKTELPTVSEGIFSAAWTLSYSIDAQPGGLGKPIQIITLSQKASGTWQAEELTEDSLHETEQMIELLQSSMAEHAKNSLSAKPTKPMPQAI